MGTIEPGEHGGILNHLYLLSAGFLLLYLSYFWWHQGDLYIHLRNADNILEKGLWSFNGDVFSYVTTSPVWVLLITAFGDMAGPWTAKVLSVGSTTLCCALIWRQRKAFLDVRWFVFALLSLSMSHWLRLSSGLGMEGSLAGALLLSIVILTRQLSSLGISGMLGVGVLSGLTILVRPELLFLPVLVCLAMTGVAAPGPQVSVFLVATLFVVTPWAMFAYGHLDRSYRRPFMSNREQEL